MKPIKTVIVLADIHAGSTVAVMPPRFTTIEGQTVTPNRVQGWLYECWQDALGFAKGVVSGDSTALVVNGDCIEGIHHRTTQVISPDTQDHVNMAIKLLKPWAELATRRFMIRGTECHVGQKELSIGTSLDFEVNPEYEGPKNSAAVHAFDRLTLDVKGCRAVFRHHIGTSVRRQLSATQLSIQLGEEQLEAANNNEPIPRVLCCAHRHKPGHFQDENGMALVSSPWQALTRFGHKIVSPARTKPGVYILDWRTPQPNGLPHVHWRTYEAPKPRAISL